MKALTIWQPWASLIMAGVKPYEFRGWPAPPAICGTRIAIHAGARPVKRQEIGELIFRLRFPDEAWKTGLRPAALPMLERWHASPALLPLASVLGTALLGEPVLASAITAKLGGPFNDSDRHAHASWAWPLTDITPLAPIVPARGAQGFWDWEAQNG